MDIVSTEIVYITVAGRYADWEKRIELMTIYLTFGSNRTLIRTVPVFYWYEAEWKSSPVMLLCLRLLSTWSYRTCRHSKHSCSHYNGLIYVLCCSSLPILFSIRPSLIKAGALDADWLKQGAHECLRCRHFRSDGACVARCPTSKYNESSVCRPCHPNCHPIAGCTGPGNGVGPSRCRACSFVKLAADQTTVLECLPPDTHQCEPGYYRRSHASATNRVNTQVTIILTLFLPMRDV